MMVTTHVAAGLLLAVSVATFAPDFAIPAAIGAIIGGILPDIDFLDLALTFALAVPAALTFDGWLRAIVIIGIVIAGGYTITRKYIPRWLEL